MIHALRIGLLIALAVPLRVVAERDRSGVDASGAPPLVRVQRLLPTAAALAPLDARGAWWSVLDSDAEPLALAAQTSPAGDAAVGYRGPSNVLLLADTDQQIIAAELIASRDTTEHVAAITDSATFFDQFRGLRIGQAIEPVDAVSGATLTSYAIAEAISLRLAGERPSLRFPRPLAAAEAAGAFASADESEPERTPAARSPSDRLPTAGPGGAGSGVEMVIRDAAGKPLGRLLRTGPLVDSLVGYQGPSEVLLVLDSEDRVLEARLRETYDNEPYVDYVRDEKYFWNHFRGRTLAELAALDAAGIEGVSGATMTSQTVAETIQVAAERYREERRAAAQESAELAARERHWLDWGWFAVRWPEVQWTAKDLVSVLFVVTAIAISSTRLRGVRWLRIVWQIALVGVFGLWTGNLLSQALLVGWAEQGVAWRLAPALAFIVGAAMLLPPLTKRNVYCHHLCPHGAAQQLLRKRLRWNWNPGRRATAALTTIPGVLLVAAYLLTLFGSDIPLAHWEPFDAYLWPVAAWGSVVLAVGSLAAAAVIPMGYCRFGCPTGRLLDYIRRTARSDRLTRRDGVVAALTIVGWLWVLF